VDGYQYMARSVHGSIIREFNHVFNRACRKALKEAEEWHLRGNQEVKFLNTWIIRRFLGNFSRGSWHTIVHQGGYRQILCTFDADRFDPDIFCLILRPGIPTIYRKPRAIKIGQPVSNSALRGGL